MSSLLQHSTIVEDYPDSYYIINARYPSLFSHEERSALRTKASKVNSTGDERYIVENPVYSKNPKSKDRFFGFKKNSSCKLALFCIKETILEYIENQTE